MEGLRQSNKGFTLVELVVVIVMLSILATITTLSLISWTHESAYRTQEDNAELIYMAARNKIAQLKADNIFDEWKYWKCTNIAGFSHTKTYMTSNQTEPDKTIYYAKCQEGDYSNYNKNRENFWKNDTTGATLVYELLGDFIHDKGLMNGNISIEFYSDGTIYSVYYSDRCKLEYSSGSSVNEGIVNIYGGNIDVEKLYDNLVGFYVSQ